MPHNAYRVKYLCVRNFSGRAIPPCVYPIPSWQISVLERVTLNYEQLGTGQSARRFTSVDRGVRENLLTALWLSDKAPRMRGRECAAADIAETIKGIPIETRNGGVGRIHISSRAQTVTRIARDVTVLATHR